MTNESLRKDLTYEEFFNMANLRPEPDGNWLYRYTGYMVNAEIPVPYPAYIIRKCQSVLFLSYTDAESFMKDAVKEIVSSDDESELEYYCHRIIQIPIGKEESNEGASWLFDSYGELLDCQLSSGTNVSESLYYFGLSPECQRFKKGDIVEVIHNDTVKLAVVKLPSMTTDECWQRYKDYVSGEIPDYYPERSDGSCIVRYSAGKDDIDYISPTNIMKPHFFVNEGKKAEMRRWLEMDADEHITSGCDVFPDNLRGTFYALQAYFDIDFITDQLYLRIDSPFGPYSALKIDSAEYYHRDCRVEMLDNDQLESLLNYLNEKTCGKSRWWYMVRQWNYAHRDMPTFILPQCTPIPDYTLLPRCK